jgi:CubicO group peptidase (beta-lactamase class C family)
MKQLVNSWVIFLAVGSLCSGCKAKRAQPDNLFSTRADSLMSTFPDFNGVVLLAKGGRPIYHRAFGYQNFVTKEKVDTASVFELASVSKQFTAMIIMQLKEENKLNFDDGIEKYLGQLHYGNITIRNLLNHTSGLPDYQAIMDAHWDKSKVADNDDIIEYLRKYHPPKLFEPGTQYEYSNTGYILLASIAELVSGEDFIELSRSKIFRPVGMNATDIRTLPEKTNIKNFAWGHIYVDEKNRYVRADSFPSSNYTIWLGNRKGPGRISSTSLDLLKWDQALYSEKIIKQKTLAEAFMPARLVNDSLSYYGFGWDIQISPNGKRIVKHNGDNPGYKTQIIRHMDENKTLIVLCNNAHRGFEKIVEQLDRLLQDE